MRRIVNHVGGERWCQISAVLWLYLVATLPMAAPQDVGGAVSKAESPIGTWRGESKCMVRPSACHDEDSVYRISAGKASDKVHLAANKIVDGREVNFGDGDCNYGEKTRSINCPLPNGNSMYLEANGSAMEGKMTLRDGTVWRKISLRRDERK